MRKLKDFDDMVKNIINFVNIDDNLSIDERNILSTEFKKEFSLKRVKWFLFKSIEERKKN